MTSKERNAAKVLKLTQAPADVLSKDDLEYRDENDAELAGVDIDDLLNELA